MFAITTVKQNKRQTDRHTETYTDGQSHKHTHVRTCTHTHPHTLKTALPSSHSYDFRKINENKQTQSSKQTTHTQKKRKKERKEKERRSSTGTCAGRVSNRYHHGAPSWATSLVLVRRHRPGRRSPHQRLSASGRHHSRHGSLPLVLLYRSRRGHLRLATRCSVRYCLDDWSGRGLAFWGERLGGPVLVRVRVLVRVHH